MNFTKLRWSILSFLFVSALAISIIAAWISNDWASLMLNYGTGIVEAVVVYVIIELVIERSENKISKKNDLILRLRSNVDDVVTLASEELYATGWLFDGSLKFTNLSGIKLPNANLSKAKLTGANLTRANLIGANMTEIKLTKARLREANLTSANLSGRTDKVAFRGEKSDAFFSFYFNNSCLDMADLSKTNLSEANLHGVNLVGANMRDSILRGTDLRRAILADSNLESADLTNANLEKAIYNKRTIWPLDFDPQKAGAIYDADFTNFEINSYWDRLHAITIMMWRLVAVFIVEIIEVIQEEVRNSRRQTRKRP